MKNRYSKTHSKDKIHDFSKSNNLLNSDKQINIQIFNITSRTRNKFISKNKKDFTSDFDDIIPLTKAKNQKRGSSNLSKRSKQINNSNNNNGGVGNVLNSKSNTFYGPITPNYNVLKKRQFQTSTKKLKQANNSTNLQSEIKSTFLKQNFFQEQTGVEDIHFQMVRFQQKCKQQLNK